MEKIIIDVLEESVAVKERSVRSNMETLMKAAGRMADGLAAGRKILIFGNGGSAADAQHIAAEFVNRFVIERRPLAALALTTDTSIITSIGNDYSFDDIFSKQISALGRKGDIAWGTSTSGSSKNVIRAIETAKEIGMFTLGMTGRGGELARRADLSLRVESDHTPRIQETHILMGHILCDLIDRILFPEGFTD
ncbi:MAG: D-sedoheptulose 7-phosphate isomerase [Desulfobacterales bacterium]|nr:D-sedoheptulose 7-phosphate isomerase [Desulfobacterales bacterium]